MESTRDIYRELQPVFFASKFVGLAPYTRTFQLSQIDSFITSTLVLSTLVITGIITTLRPGDETTFSLILERGQVILLGLSAIVSLIGALLNADHLAGLARNFLAIDNDLKSVNIFVSHSSRFGIIQFIVRTLILVPVIILDALSASPIDLIKILKIYIRIMPQFVTFVVEVQFIVLVHALKTRVLIMTKAVDALARKSYPHKPKKLMVMSTSHSTLVEMASTINNMFTLQMLLIMFTIFLLATAHLYHLNVAITTLGGEMEYFASLTLVLKLGIRCYEVWTLTTTCVGVQEVVSMKWKRGILR